MNIKVICRDSLHATCLFPYNDSLILAGGSINGKATLFFLSTEDLAIKKQITLNSLYGNITSIERASDGEFLLLAENKVNKKFDSFLALKTKNLGKDAYPVSVDLGNEPISNNFAQLYPNPASDYITLNIPTLEKREQGGVSEPIRIFDVLGNCALSLETQNFVSLQKIDVSALPAGIYFVRIVNEKIMKFIKI